ncbi:class I SAM-dependent methyltransferase [Puniceicoccus vermicola]|uniref:FkbM family methyltransferase n=1 Tax=Puniceicoccus vermicola TaxID=388746 RepID=A0A7X1AY64_9BACT|nr:hypothetical protein [Puniceicoccus vermicola]MBC2602057.1 hypothetical protein [Puniceicoccus vermicola]
MVKAAYTSLKRKLPHWAQPYLLAHWLYYWVCGRKVIAGPFQGLRYVYTSVGSAYYNKLIATYEVELHDEVQKLIDLNPAKIIDVGTAEGYYAAGFASKIPDVEVVAFEGDPLGRSLQRKLLKRNGLENRVRIEGFCDPEALDREIGDKDPTLVILDCEGYENELFDLEKVPGLANCHLLIELHFFAHADILERLKERSKDTHDLKHIELRERTLDDFPKHPILNLCPKGLKKYFMLEGRNEETEWLILSPKQS